VDLKFPGGGKQQIKMSDVKSITDLKVSMMPDGLHQGMSSQELADLLEYLKNLKKK
jgi:putative heme-binding domain-containing protein